MKGAPTKKRDEIILFYFFRFKLKTNLKVFKLTWKIWNRLNRKKNQISDLCDFYYSSYGHFCTQNDPNFRLIFTNNSINKNRKKKLFSFSFYSAHSASGSVVIKDMQTPLPQKWWKLYERCGICWTEREK